MHRPVGRESLGEGTSGLSSCEGSLSLPRGMTGHATLSSCPVLSGPLETFRATVFSRCFKTQSSIIVSIAADSRGLPGCPRMPLVMVLASPRCPFLVTLEFRVDSFGDGGEEGAIVSHFRGCPLFPDRGATRVPRRF